MKGRKRKLISICCMLFVIAGMTGISSTECKAASQLPVIDGSYLTYEEESIGYDTKLTRGEDLLAGYSKVRRRGPGLLYAGGSTVATHTVKEVGIAVIVERAKEKDESWEFYDSWQKFNYDVDKVSSDKELEVEGGYYYRVRCTHSANGDMSSSFTNGVYIYEPFNPDPEPES